MTDVALKRWIAVLALAALMSVAGMTVAAGALAKGAQTSVNTGNFAFVE